jgi:hypothetical protein
LGTGGRKYKKIGKIGKLGGEKFAIFRKCHKDEQSKDGHVWEDSITAHNTVIRKHEEKRVFGA